MFTTTSLNTICPYYTMYRLDFPLRVLKWKKRCNQWVLDPFCGRGTTNFAARLLGLPSVGFDSSPIAVAIAKAKLVQVSVDEVMKCARLILKKQKYPRDLPEGEFWQWAYHEKTLYELCCFREALLTIDKGNDPVKIMLRAIILGALHGPIMKREASYFSNQCLRTFAPKPAYAIRFWKERKMYPLYIDTLKVIFRRAQLYLEQPLKPVDGFINNRDSRKLKSFHLPMQFSWVITSPPYYGMRTYLSDQWLRGWFLGNKPEVNYQSSNKEITHTNPQILMKQLTKVWRNVATVCKPDARLVCRFGRFNKNSKEEPLVLIKSSFNKTPWRITAVRSAGNAADGQRQAVQFGHQEISKPRQEYDLYAVLDN